MSDENLDREETLTRAYLAGREAARHLGSRSAPAEYEDDHLAAINWECGWDDMVAEISEAQ
jgi:hypothetical protein